MILEQLSGGSGDLRMRWRHGPRAGAEQRHRAFGDVIWWSYELCGDKERLLFDRLSVFAPGYDLNPEDAGTVWSMWKSTWRPSKWFAPTTCRARVASMVER